MKWAPPEELLRRNRALIAKGLGWPDGALAAVVEITKTYPLWTVWWSDRRPEGRGYRAERVDGGRRCRLWSESPEGLREELARAEEQLKHL